MDFARVHSVLMLKPKKTNPVLRLLLFTAIWTSLRVNKENDKKIDMVDKIHEVKPILITLLVTFSTKSATSFIICGVSK